MSIWDEVARRAGEGRLLKLVPLLPARPEVRGMYLTPPAHQALDGPWANIKDERRFGFARNLLEGFIEGDEIVGRMPPSKRVDTVIALLTPEVQNVWEFRVGTVTPGLRLFGRFALKDVFIGTHWVSREAFMDPVTRKDDLKQWNIEMNRCKAEWRKLFSVYTPLTGVTLHDYISNARLPV